MTGIDIFKWYLSHELSEDLRYKEEEKKLSLRESAKNYFSVGVCKRKTNKNIFCPFFQKLAQF